MFGLGAGELGVILFIILLFVGPKKLPELAKGLGRGLKEFQRARTDVSSSINNSIEQTSENEQTDKKMSNKANQSNEKLS